MRLASRGGATVLKVGGQFRERSERKNFFDPPTLRLPGGGYKNEYGCTKFAHRNGIMILKKSEKSFLKVIVMTDDVVMCSFVSLH